LKPRPAGGEDVRLGPVAPRDRLNRPLAGDAVVRLTSASPRLTRGVDEHQPNAALSADDLRSGHRNDSAERVDGS